MRTRIGVALQEIGLDPVQTGRELLELQCGLYGIAPQAGVARTGSCSSIVGLDEAADRRIKGYSGGMKRRLDLAAALVHDPQVLFLDEPTTGLDPSSRQTIWEEVRLINGRGTTIFLTTQYLEEADELCDRLAIIDEGEHRRRGRPGQLKAQIGTDVVSIELERADAAAHASRARGARRARADRRRRGQRLRSSSPTAPARSSRSCAGSTGADHGRDDLRLAAVARRRVPRGDRPPALR